MGHAGKRVDGSSKPIGIGLLCAVTLALSIYIGSGGMKHFDHALFWYAMGSVGAAFAVGYRFTLWMNRPPTRMYFKRGLQLLFRKGPKFPKGTVQPRAKPEYDYAKATMENFVGQKLIRKRSYYRWIMHLCLSGGCSLAFAVTFPLVFGWIHFETPMDDAETYHVMVWGKQMDTFEVHSVKAILMFNVLNISGIIVMVGLVMAAWRRLSDAGERAVQTFYEDILPLILIAAVTLTGLALTVSYKFMDGQGHGSLVWIHMVCVIGLIFYIPFGKLFHIFQRTISLCVSVYKKSGADEAQQVCLVTGKEYAPKRQVEDLKEVLDELNFDYRFTNENGESIHYQDISPEGRRRLVALNQGMNLGR